MREDIKKRIEAVNRGEVPEGYRVENGYLIPNEWKTVPLNDRFTRSTRKNKAGCENVLTISAQMGLVNQREFYDKDIASEDKSGYFLMKNGEFAYNKSYSTGYPYGAIKQLTKYDEGIVSPLYICFAPKTGTNTAFYTQYFEGGRYNREIYRVAQEGARNHGLLNIAVEDFFTGTLVEPSAGEQQKIAEILATCDRAIELKQQLLEEKRKAFRCAMVSVFGNSDEYTTLGEIAKITMGQSPDSSSYNTDEDGVPLLQGNADIANGLPLPRYYTNSPTKMCSPGDLLLSVRAPVGEVSKTDISACIGRGMCSINAGNLTEYVFYYLKYYEPNWNRISQGSTFTAISGDDIKKVPIPVVDEKVFLYQAKVLSCANTEIRLLEQELAAWQQKKKALMQLLLTGLVRVNA